MERFDKVGLQIRAVCEEFLQTHVDEVGSFIAARILKLRALEAERLGLKVVWQFAEKMARRGTCKESRSPMFGGGRSSEGSRGFTYFKGTAAPRCIS